MIEYNFIKDTIYIRLSGELDHATAPSLRGKIDQILSQENYQRFILDLSSLRFMDSTGVGLIIGRYKLLRSKKKQFVIKSPSPQVDKVLSVSGIYSIIPKVM